MNHLVYDVATWLTRHLVLPPYGRIVSVQGLENLPRTGPLIIASNHLNDADPGILCLAVPRRIVFLAKEELFKYPGLSHYMRAFGSIPVHRHQADLTALRHAAQALKDGYAVCIFPEGTGAGARASLGQAYPGAGLMALRNEVPVVPLAITGSQHLKLPRLFLRPFRPYRITVTIGRPFQLPRPQRINGEAAQQATAHIMQRIAALLPPEYRGYYGNAADSQTPAPAPEPQLSPATEANVEDEQGADHSG